LGHNPFWYENQNEKSKVLRQSITLHIFSVAKTYLKSTKIRQIQKIPCGAGIYLSTKNVFAKSVKLPYEVLTYPKIGKITLKFTKLHENKKIPCGAVRILLHVF
jgi:hypothetical protein